LSRLLLAAYFVEAGLLLVISPWTSWFRRNFFAARFPWLQAYLSLNAVQMLVIIAGLVTAAAGIFELRQLFTQRSSGPVPTPPDAPPEW
jgi:hypothetical protein